MRSAKGAGSRARPSPCPSARPVAVTPVQMARVAAVVANGGRLVEAAPHAGHRRPGGARARAACDSASGPRSCRWCATPCCGGGGGHGRARPAGRDRGRGQDRLRAGGRRTRGWSATRRRTPTSRTAGSCSSPAEGRPWPWRCWWSTAWGRRVRGASGAARSWRAISGCAPSGPASAPPEQPVPAALGSLPGCGRLAAMAIDRRLLHNIEWACWRASLLIAGIGVATIVSATNTRCAGIEVKQLYCDEPGHPGADGRLRLDYRRLVDRAHMLYVLTVAALAAVLLWGPRIAGTKRWFVLGGHAVTAFRVRQAGGGPVRGQGLRRVQAGDPGRARHPGARRGHRRAGPAHRGRARPRARRSPGAPRSSPSPSWGACA